MIPPRRQLVIAAVAPTGLVALRVVGVVDGPASILGLAEASLVALWLIAAASWSPRLMAVAALVAAMIVAAPLAVLAAVIVAHHAVAVIAWAALSPRSRRVALHLCASLLAAAVAVRALGGDVAGDPSLDGLRLALFPSIGADLGRALVIALGVLQAVHHAIGLMWRSRGGLTRTVATLAALAALVAAAVDVRWARATCLSLAAFHLYIELAVLVTSRAGVQPRARRARRAASSSVS